MKTNPIVEKTEVESPFPKTLIKNSPKSRKKIILIALVIVALIITGICGYYLGANNKKSITNSKITSNLTTKPTLKPKVEYEIYNYPAGFSIAYLKYNDYGTPSCETKTNKQWGYEYLPQGRVKLQLFNDFEKKEIILANEVEAVIKSKKNSDGSYVGDFSTCKVIKTTEDIAKNGYEYENGFPPPDNISNIGSGFKYYYKEINSDNDLTNLSQSVYGEGCTTIKKTPIVNNPGVYWVEVYDKNGQTGPEAECNVNSFVYLFLYSSNNEVAIASQGFQECPFSSTVNINDGLGGCGIKFIF